MNTITRINPQQNIRPINRVNNRYPNNAGRISFTSSKSDMAMRLLSPAIDNLVNGTGCSVLNKIKFHKLLNEAIPSIITPENYLNAGRESKVYKISDKYVAKIRRGFYSDNSVNILNPISMPSKHYKELSAYYGEAVVKHGPIEILKNATPTSDNIFCGVRFLHDYTKRLKDMERYEKEFVPKCSRIPQESFDELAFNLKKLNGMSSLGIKGKQYYVPDIINPNNIIISDNKFRIVDKLDKVPVKNPNTLFTMLEPLLLRVTPEESTKYNPKLVEPRKNILKKCLISSEKAELPMNSPMTWEFSEWTLADVLPESGFVEELYRMRAKKVPLDERIEYINKSVSKITEDSRKVKE